MFLDKVEIIWILGEHIYPNIYVVYVIESGTHSIN